ncbi:hypothetical protein PJN38_24310 [Mycobacterium kansasii]
MTDYRKTAALALAKCAAYDPWFPKASQAIVDSWAEQIERYQLSTPDVLAGVTKMYADNGSSGFRPLPKDLTDAARAVRRERNERESEAERRAREDRRDAELENRNRLAEITAGIAESKAIPDA